MIIGIIGLIIGILVAVAGIYYLGKEILKMSDYEFWRSTPKQLIIKSRIYSRFKNNENDDPESEVPFGYIDVVF